jgi:hypothetical protein
MTRYYVYALLDAPLAGRLRGARRMEFVGGGGLFAAVERHAAPPALSEKTLRSQHRRVVALARAARAILPVRFGAWVDADELARLLRLRRGVLRDALKAVRGKEQMTVRVLGRAEAPSPVRARDSGTAYLLARAASARPVVPPVAKVIQRAVAPLVASETLDPGVGEIQVTLNHLVSRGSSRRYRSLIASAIADLDAGPPVVVTGPWPPFAFAPDLWLTETEDALVRS